MNVASFFGFGPSVSLRFELENDLTRIPHPHKPSTKVPLLRKIDSSHTTPSDVVKGQLIVHVPEGSIEHNGLSIELLGIIETPHDRPTSDEFMSLKTQAMSFGTLQGQKRFRFDFSGADLPHESYYGRSVTLKYLLRATVSRSYYNSIVEEMEVIVYRYEPPMEDGPGIQLEVGIDECLHIDFHYHKSRYQLHDVVRGQVQFSLVRIKIKYMELAVLRRETVAGHTETETITQFELMDGAPVKGETVPIRMHLSSLPLTPTLRGVHDRFSTRYFFNLVLVDDEDRRYFKQHEIGMWRPLEPRNRNE